MSNLALTLLQQAHLEPDDLLRIERQRSEAIAQQDLDFLQHLYADDFQGLTALGYEVSKARLMDVFQRDNPEIIFALEAMQARVFDQAALVTGRLLSHTRMGERVAQSRFLHVYLRRAGRWQIVAGQGTPVTAQPLPE